MFGKKDGIMTERRKKMLKREKNSQFAQTGKLARKRSLWEEVKRNKFFYLIPIPGIITMILFSYLPMAGIYMAFENYSYDGGLFGSEFVGLRNFQIFFDNVKYVLRATRNTVIINLGGIFLGTILKVAVAIMLGEIRNDRYRKTTQTIMIFPNFLSWIVVGVISDTILNDKNGLINQLIQWFGGEGIGWSLNAGYWWPILIIAGLWKAFGYGSIIYYATLTGFDPGLYEAADIDGAGRWQKITRITVPLLKPTIAILLLLDVGGILGGSLEQIMGMTKMNPLILESTDTIATYIYRTTTSAGQFGIASAVSFYQSLFGFVLVLSANLLAKKIDPDYALF